MQQICPPVLQRYGGWYSDLDTVTLANTDYLEENIVGSAGSFVSNAHLIFTPHHPFLLELMKEANSRFNGQGWNSVGKLGMTDLTQ